MTQREKKPSAVTRLLKAALRWRKSWEVNTPPHEIMDSETVLLKACDAYYKEVNRGR